MAGAEFHQDLNAAAAEELARACTLSWRQLSELAPWGDSYEGFTPLGRTVTFERNYLWEGEPGGGIRIEVNVFEPEAFEDGAQATCVVDVPQDEIRQ
ncbi:MAG: hypothetical protein ACK4YQ_14945 [Phenylobacterium sp.]|uniref:hypothetical protein n=1 Tax=Phenylobacterium sp. TaxID=1871053 RepID=UPI00391DA842